MRCLLAIILALTALGVPAKTITFEPVKLRFGTIREIKPVKPEEIQLAWDVAKFGPQPAPREEETFVILALSLADQRSIGKYDYTLDEQPCLAIAFGDDQPFDPANWNAAAPDQRRVRLLFLVSARAPGESHTFKLTYEIPSLTDPHERERLLMLPGEVPDAPAPAAAPADGTAPTQDTAPAGGATAPALEPIPDLAPAAPAAEPAK